jgi:hypothetical protein
VPRARHAHSLPHCRNPIELVATPAKEEILCSSCGSSFRLDSSSTTDWSEAGGRKLGKFELLDTLGQGAFGTVYKARARSWTVPWR